MVENTASPPASANNWTVLSILIIAFVAVGGLVGYLTNSGESFWYRGLEKPPFNPPGYLFGIVWPLLYALMGIATWMIWQSPKSPQRTRALQLFGVQLAFNYIWPFLFFAFQMIAVAAGWILGLIVILAFAIRAFSRIKPVSAVLLLPYFAWSVFAYILNASILYLNA
ncbi:MAG: TspO/MBR family protein [Pseudomonadota bacterium]